MAIYSGMTVSNYFRITKGDTATDTTVNSGGSMDVWYHGRATTTTVNSGGSMTVSSGGTVSSTTVKAGGTINISSGGNAMSTTVKAGGIINGFTVQADNYYDSELHVSNAIVYESATLLWGQTALATTVSSDGNMYVRYGGTAMSTTVNSRGYMNVSFGGTATDTTVNCYGSMYVSSRGTATSTTVNSGGNMYVRYGGTATSTMVNSGGEMYVLSGGTASIVFSPWGRGYVSSAYGANVTYLERDANVYWGNNSLGIIGKGNSAERVIISSGVSMLLYSNGVVNATTVSSGGTMSVANGCSATATTVNSGGKMTISGGGAMSTMVYGSMYVSSGGSTISTTVNSGGNMMVSGGGFASATSVKTGGIINGFTISEDQYYASGLHVSNAYVTGRANLYDDQTATNTTVNGGGNMYVLNGGRALSTMLNAGGNMYVLSGGTASITFRPWGRGYVSSAYGANVTYLERDANVYWGNNNSGVIGKGNSAERVIISSGVSMLLYSNGVVNATTVNSGGTMSIFAGGQGNDTTVNAYGSMSVFSGGRASGLQLKSNGSLKLHDALAENVTISRGGSAYISGGTIRNLALASRGSATVSNAEINGADVYSSGRLNCVSHQEGRMVISGAVIRSDGQITMSSGTSISGAIVSKAGTLNLANGGSAYYTALADEGKLTMLGVAHHTVLNGGSMFVGESAYRYYDGTGGLPTSNVYPEDIHASINILNSSWMHIYSGGTATSNTVTSNSWAHVYWGGTATSNVINSSGYLTVQGSGTADTTLLHSGGYMRLYAGAILKGESNVGGKVTVTRAGTSATEDVIRAYGAKINFLVSERTVSDESIITDLGMIMGATYFVTISSVQQSGTYRLADGAGDFTGSITVMNENRTKLGTLSCGGQLSYGKHTYSLTKTDGTLSFTVSANTQRTYTKGDLICKGTPDILMVNPAASDAGAWLLDAKGNASWLGLSGLPGTWELFDTGNANGDIYSDVFLYDAANKDFGVWTMNAKGVPGWESWGQLEADCDLIATRDFNGDGLTDVLYRRSNGAIGTYMNGTGGHFEVPLPLDWNMVGVGDINGDGTDDLILRNGNSIGAWLMSANGPRWQGLADVGTANRIVGLGDFNGDGTADILFNSNGSYGAWLMKDGQITGWKAFCDFPTSIAVEAIGDYNGDVIDDLRVRNGNDLAAVMVYTDGLEWKGFGSVPSDWKTSLAGPV